MSNATETCYVTAKSTRAWLKMVLLLHIWVVGETVVPRSKHNKTPVAARAPPLALDPINTC